MAFKIIAACIKCGQVITSVPSRKVTGQHEFAQEEIDAAIGEAVAMKAGGFLKLYCTTCGRNVDIDTMRSKL
jgi:L-lactate utilization protein LutB